VHSFDLTCGGRGRTVLVIHGHVQLYRPSPCAAGLWLMGQSERPNAPGRRAGTLGWKVRRVEYSFGACQSTDSANDYRPTVQTASISVSRAALSAQSEITQRWKLCSCRLDRQLWPRPRLAGYFTHYSHQLCRDTQDVQAKQSQLARGGGRCRAYKSVGGWVFPV